MTMTTTTDRSARKKVHKLAIVSAKERVLAYANPLLHDDTGELRKPLTHKSRATPKLLMDEVPESEDELAAEAKIARMTMGQLALTVPKGVRADADAEEEDEGDDHIAKKTRVASSGAPRVEFIDGRIVISESSLTVHDDELTIGHEGSDADEADGRARRHSGGGAETEVPLTTGGAGYLAGRRTSKRWTHPETTQFYYALSQVGADFTLMATLFPRRTRQELKIKFKSEEKARRSLVDIALSAAARPLDQDIVEMVTGILAKEKQVKERRRLADDDELEEDEVKEMPDMF
ncbi:hypothetical protein ACHHYP_01710 [Achlya hypogyna]|uniref:Myb-like domain-containing protein n=1 Tax=Achlya hypogyna TaxID=1202772 RepID=A0A1V9ZTS6_ACHHY|nr:hypothetical protein ACHHYP_01710 [Achlya hypogyna]